MRRKKEIEEEAFWEEGVKKPKMIEFLEQSNAIEGIYSIEALQDAILAYKYLLDVSLTWKPFAIDTLLKTHEILMQTWPFFAGKLRDYDVYIGGEKKKFVSKAAMTKDLNTLFTAMYKYYRELRVHYRKAEFQDLNELAMLLHLAFEYIHPFGDGNGRIGRIYWQLFRFKCQLTIEIIHVGEEQQEYYQLFKKYKPEVEEFFKLGYFKRFPKV